MNLTKEEKKKMKGLKLISTPWDYESVINGSWESELRTLEKLDPTKKHGAKLGQDIQFKANALITVNFGKDDEATTKYKLVNIKPI